MAASTADIPPDNPNDNKTFLANEISTYFINDKPTVINGLNKLKNPPSLLVAVLF